MRPGARFGSRTSNVMRFEHYVAPGENGCWVWSGKTNGRGYGVINLVGRKSAYAHRWSYEFHRAPIPAGLEIDHLCRNTLCVNPWHLEPVTPAVNKERMVPVTVCKYGHEYTPENTYWRPASVRGARDCLTCKRERQRRYARTA